MNISFSEEQINYLQNYNIFIKKFINNIENTENTGNTDNITNDSDTLQQQNQERYQIENGNFNIPIAMPVILPTTNYVYNGRQQDETTLSGNEHIIVDYSDNDENTNTNSNSSVRRCSYNTKACIVLFVTVCTLPALLALVSTFYIFID